MHDINLQVFMLQTDNVLELFKVKPHFGKVETIAFTGGGIMIHWHISESAFPFVVEYLSD